MTSGPALLLTFARRGETAEIARAVNHLREHAPESHVVALATPVSASLLREMGVTDLILYGGGQGASAAVRAARRRHPRAVAIVYCGPRFRAHLKLEAFALLSGARRVYLVSPELPPQASGRARLVCSVLAKMTAAGGRLWVGALICGIAFVSLRLAQMVTGGRHADRA